MKNVLKRLFAITLAICIVLPVFPQLDAAALAATDGTVTGLADGNIGLSFSGDADNAWNASGTQIIGSATGTGGTCGDTHYESTLTITNNKTTKATLSFDYAIEQNSGTIQVDGTAVTANSKFSKELAPNASIKVYIKSGSTSAATKINMTNVALVSNVSATVTFQPAKNGSYTVDGKAITEAYTNTQSSLIAYQVAATPAAGYQFMGWYNVTDGKYINTSPKAALNIESDCTITARFVSKDLALFETGGQVFDDLNEAVAYAQANKQSKITLATDGSISGNYTIPAGITLLIPFDAAGTLYTDAPAAIRTTPASKPFRTLTMSEGTSITVNGAISLGGRYYAAGGSEQGRIVGPYGYIKMESDSSITVKNGGNLYAWGFISGSGSVLAESGAKVYEFYQIADFRGGTASSGMGNGVFPFSQYFVQNIEVPLTLNAGANEQVYSGVYAMSTTFTTAINFIGDNGMFKVASGSFTKDYDEKTDRLVFTVNGEAALNTLSLTLAGNDINSASYILPITNNITINIQSGNVTINQDAALLAGVEVNIAEGAGLTVANGKNIYFYDSDEWNSDNFVWGPCKFKSVAYAPGKAYNRSNNDLVDAKMDVNGSVTAIGAIYTTKGGADICSSNGTGVYLQQGTPGKATATYQYNANGNKAVTITITSAKLHNADGAYTETATANAGDVINYVNGVWGGEVSTDVTVTFEPNGSEEYPVVGTMEPQIVTKDAETELTANAFTREGYDFNGWNTAADGTGTAYVDKATVNLTENTTLYAQWEIQKFTVTWVNEDGTELEKDENVEYGTTPKYNGQEPTKEGDAQYTYKFKGWAPEIAAVTGDVTYTAVFEQTVNEYTVTWKNYDGSVLETDENVKYGTMPEYNGATPTKEGDAQYTYTFTGWTPEIAAVTGDVTYTAQFTGTVNEYTVTWKNGDEVLQSGKVRYGETPKYNGEKPIREQTDDKTYTFIGWSPDVKEVNGDATYTAKFSETARKYKITWVIGGEKETEEVAYGVKPTHAEPTKDTDEHYSYEFSGWQPAITDVSGDATYTATFTSTPVEYTITFDTDGGTPVAPIKQGYGKEITAPAAPTKTGYTFAGWDKDIPTTMPAENMTIKAQWTVNKYTITFNTDGGTEIASKTQNYGTDIAAPAAPTKTGYTFVKWDRAIPATMPAEDVTITAQWKINQYTITFFDTDGVTEILAITQDYGTAITAPADPTKTGYTFAGWDRAIPATMPAENVTITAKWTVNQYTITLMVDGTEQITIHDDYGADISQYIGAINKEGYDFIGWAKEDGTLFTQTTMPAENLVLHACWGINQYTITFDTDGGTEIAPIIADYGTPIAAPADPTKIGYTFAGWDKDIPVTMPAENVTITAKWTINQYTIAFDTDGGSYIAPITQDYNTAVTAPENPSKTGYTFAGWDMAIPATMPAENVTIKAQWTINQYTITFDTDGGSTIESITQDYGTDIIAPAAPTKEGYVFDGWDKNIPATMPAENLYIKAKWKAKTYNITWIVDGQGTTTTAEYNKLPSYGENNPTKAATAEYKYEFIGWDPELKPATEDATYTAKFREEPIIYTITWNVDGTGTDDSFAYGAEITAPAAPTKEGYTFTGWMIAEGEMLPETMPAKNIVATAQWAKNKYKLTFEAEGYGGEPADVEWGTTIHAPASVSKEGHTLEGWYYTDGEEEKKFDFEADKMPMHDLTLTAKWTINQYTITFDTDGGNTIDSITLDYGTAITAPEAPTKDGYTFKEWSPALPETMPAGDMTVKAIYDYTYTGWITDENGKTYLENGKKTYNQTWATIEEHEYYFNAYGYVVTGWQELDKDGRSTLFVFDNDGVFQSKMNGVNTNDAGDIYWVENGGVVKDKGLVRVEVPGGGGYYYYFDPNPDVPDNKGKAFKGSDEKPQCKVVYNNDLKLPAGNNYKFGSDGIIEHFEDYPNGIYLYPSGGNYYYCVDGVIIANGLMQIDGYYYYAKTSTGAFVCRQSYWITKTNGLLDEGIYKFDEQGRIVFPEEVKNGIVAENGSLYYYVDGKLTGAGLIQIEGNYYYVKTSNGEVVHGRNYWITTNNGLLPVDKYTFDEDGKLINPPVVEPNPDPEPEVKNGIVGEMGSLYYYVDGKLTGAGLIQIEGNYYYVKTSNCEVVHGRNYWITVTNDLLPAGQYKFDQDGKMVR